MRILMISDHADPLAKIGTKETGGQNVYVLNIASLLAKLGVKVDVYTRWDRATKQEVVEAQPNFRVIRVKAGPKSYMPRDDFLQVTDEFARRIKQRIERENLAYDCIFSHYWFSGIIGLDVARTYSWPQTHVYHSIGQNRYEALQEGFPQSANFQFFKTRGDWERRIAHESTSIISTSPVERDELVRLFEIPADKIDIIPVGVDTLQFRPYSTRAIRRRLGLPTDKPVILYAGRLEWRKGIATLLEAMEELGKQWPESQLYIIGGGSTKTSKQLDNDELNRLHSITQELGLQNRVHFLGARPQAQMALFYAAADACAVPSYYEPFGIVPLEAMACGTPVIASRIGGLQYSVQDGVTGHLVMPRCPIDLAAKLHTVLSKGKEAYSEAARHRVLQQFAWPSIAQSAAAHLSRLNSRKGKQERINIETIRPTTSIRTARPKPAERKK